MKALSVASIVLLAAATQSPVAADPPVPDVPEPEIEINPSAPFAPVEGPEEELLVYKVGGRCKLTGEQRDRAWINFIKTISKDHPDFLRHCDPKLYPQWNSMRLVNDVCRASVACAKNVDGVDILRGEFVVEVDQETQEIQRVLEVPW
ncbi:hypothetical protein F3N42_14985 [Marinihelvus fidelis]|uniref:Secreted protein n=1 Tax=Marinihelvus fidelis TaxID=2613842 RepID=A0A5N0T696_9GAMM|nr:hypothetical protein [Marinihelvus fidelis]KAA9129667.1 hypothetical protein F3N42_14985 [Marinihelvus fidelis]